MPEFPTCKRLSSTAAAVAILCAVSVPPTSAAAEPPAAVAANPADPAARLTALGAKLKRDKAGQVVEVSMPHGVQMGVDDWKAVGQLPALTKIWSGGDGVPLGDETIAHIAGLRNVEEFFANGAIVTDDALKAFAGWTKLRRFGFDHWFGPKGMKGYLGSGLVHLKDLPALEHVRLGGCRVDNTAATALAQCKTLRSVDLFHTFAVTDDGVAAIATLPELRRVVLAPQFTTRVTDASLAHLGKAKLLEELNVGETKLTYADGFSHLKGLANLKVVKLDKSVVDEADLTKFKADHPAAKVEWTPADAASVERVEKAFAKRKAEGEKK